MGKADGMILCVTEGLFEGALLGWPMGAPLGAADGLADRYPLGKAEGSSSVGGIVCLSLGVSVS